MPRRYIFALAIIAILFFLGIGLLISLITRGNSGSNTKKPAVVTQTAKDFAKDTNNVSYTVFGPVVGEEDRRAIRITISANERRAEVLNGYYEIVSKSQTTANNQAAFDALLLALKGAGFDQYDKANKTIENTVCTTGRHFSYQANFSGNDVLSSWSTSCSSKQGNFQGNRATVQTLMQAQIPNYTKFAEGVKL
jgi:hypothetical protein